MKKLIIGLVAITVMLFTSVNAQSPGANQALDARQQRIVTIASLASVGELEKLKPELVAGLDAGLTVNQIKEVLVHIYAYSGFPRSLRGLQTFMAVLDDRKVRGINDTMGPDATSITDTRGKYERGKDILAELSGTPAPAGRVTAGYAGFAPIIETFLKEHLFADIFERDVLTYAQREMVTVSVLMSIGGVEPMMRSHMNLSLNVGVTPEQLREMVQLIGTTIGRKEADAATGVLNAVLESRFASQPAGQTTAASTTPEQELLQLSRQKWQWMADKNVEALDRLFHAEAVFVHMGGTMNKEQELGTIRSGGIHYKHADIENTTIRFVGNTAIILDKIRLTAVVGGNEVVNPFMVTEVYVPIDGQWKLGSLSFTRLLGE